MAIGLRRKVRLDSRRENQKLTRNENGKRKARERARRDARMAERVKATKDGDYAPEVASWIAAQLGKPAKKASADEIKTLIG